MTVVLVYISVSDPDDGYFSEHGFVSRDRTSLCVNWIPYSLIFAT